MRDQITGFSTELKVYSRFISINRFLYSDTKTYMHKEMLSVVYAKRVTMQFVRHLLVYSEKMMI